ncbi:MAG TPA: Type 1 glutamine amidotransferase-like domain-containing protein [Galbitalea sp.]|nr:Type 1 glutamine amidotransferase-like domain-containing protein [Galbitalea sp.]
MKLYLASYDPGGVPSNLADLIGENQPVAITANANDGMPQNQRAAGLANEIARLSAIGLHSEELDLRRYFDHTKNLEDDLGAYGAIWAMGGNAFVLRRAMRYSGLDEILPRLLRASRLTYGGYSAGAVVAGPTLHGIDLVDDPHEVPVSYQSNVVWSGLDLVPYRIAPHYRSRDSQTFQIEQVVDYFVAHNAKYRTLSDGQAIVIDGQSEQVLDFRAPELRSLETIDPSEWHAAP